MIRAFLGGHLNLIGYEGIYLISTILMLVPLALLVHFEIANVWMYVVCLVPATIFAIIGAIMYHKLPQSQKVKPKFSLIGGVLSIHPYVHTGWMILMQLVLFAFAILTD